MASIGYRMDAKGVFRRLGLVEVSYSYPYLVINLCGQTWSLTHPGQFTCVQRLPQTFEISLDLFLVDKSTRHPKRQKKDREPVAFNHRTRGDSRKHIEAAAM